MSKHQGGPPRLGDHIGDRKCLAGAGGPQQCLELLAPSQPRHQAFDRLGLIALGLIGGVELKWAGHLVIFA